MTHRMPVAEPRRHGVSPCQDTAPLPALLDRWDVLALVTGLRRHLCLADRDILVLRAHLSVLPHGPLRVGDLNVSFMNLSEIQDRACGMDERRFRRGEVRLEEVGLIHRNLSANGRRFPERDASGTVVRAYGIDLSPLLARVPELETLRAKIEDADRQRRQRRNALSARISALVRSFGSELPDQIATLRDALRNVLRRKAICEQELKSLESQLSTFEAKREQEQEIPTPLAAPDSPPADAGQTVRHVEPELKDKYDGTAIAEVWHHSATLRQFYESPPSDQGTAWRILTDFASFLTVPRQTVDHLIAMLGWPEAVYHLDRVATCIETIKRPGRYLEAVLAKAAHPRPHRASSRGCEQPGRFTAVNQGRVVLSLPG